MSASSCRSSADTSNGRFRSTASNYPISTSSPGMRVTTSAANKLRFACATAWHQPGGNRQSEREAEAGEQAVCRFVGRALPLVDAAASLSLSDPPGDLHEKPFGRL